MSAVGLAVRAAAVSALGFALVPVLGANPAMACSCIQSTEQENYDRADVVFRGTMDDVEAANDRFGARVFVFTPSTTYKGKTTTPQKVSTAGDSAMCGVDLTGAGPFLVFANKADDGKAALSTSLCSGTREIESDEEPDFEVPVNKSTKVDSGPRQPKGDTPVAAPDDPGTSGGGADPVAPPCCKPLVDESDGAPTYPMPLVAPDERADGAVDSDDAPSGPGVAAIAPADDTPLMLQTSAVASDSAAAGESAHAAGDDSTNYLPFAAAVAAFGAAGIAGLGWARRRRS
ncbi:MAG: hypothetical protein ACT4QG_05960 [Sporichthyaceae bacterium]